MEFFATCPTGFEQLLAHELEGLGTPRVRPLTGQVAFEGELAAGLRVCLWSRLASRVIVVLGRFACDNADKLYEGMGSVPWEKHFAPGATFAIRASGTNAQLKNTQFIALKAKDAVVDRLAARRGTRPNVDATNPDLALVVRISGKRATVGIDLAGTPLFFRGYERRGNERGLRSDYASALLALGGWRELCASGGASAKEPDTNVPAVLDVSPALGSVLVEAALQSANRAPGLLRLRWGFERWAGHDPDVWEDLLAEARALAQESPSCTLYALAQGKRSLSATRAALRAAGMTADLHLIRPEQLTVQTNANDAASSDAPRADLVICDLSDLFAQDLVQETAGLVQLSELARTLQPGAIALASRSDLADAYLGNTPLAKVESMLGRDPVALVCYPAPSPDQKLSKVKVGPDEDVLVLVDASDQFAARLRKVARLRKRWAQHEDVTCYRVYDTDLPDYAVAIDLYQGSDPATGELDGRRWLAIAEYAPPKGVDAGLARRRLADVLAIAPRVLDVRPQDTYLRVRSRAKGGSAYADEARLPSAGDSARHASRRRTKAHGEVPLPPASHLVDEGGLTFEVNFLARHDCGIFLDHRPTRALLREMAKRTKGSKRFLNLFAYTGTATCYAADGGMRHTTTVDLSRPSLDWARRNMERNGFVGREHEFVQADVIRWVQEQRHTPNRWDLVFCDVPTFSNSSRMGRRSFDVQRDHAELLIGISRLLTRDGVCVFSCNLRTFRPDNDKLARAGVTIEDITDQTIPEDFARNRRVHHTYLVRRAPRS